MVLAVSHFEFAKECSSSSPPPGHPLFFEKRFGFFGSFVSESRPQEMRPCCVKSFTIIIAFVLFCLRFVFLCLRSFFVVKPPLRLWTLDCASSWKQGWATTPLHLEASAVQCASPHTPQQVSEAQTADILVGVV
mmetsp:Transcript_12250/g.18418  ORF Transcript_12250/g.18418 Transcript_12250/m.18418 type:complete len:134 (+) Transcript_12250:75-476(+)